MTVKNFWRQLKHKFLHHYLRPHLDLLTWILINNVTPAYVARSAVMQDTHCLVHPNILIYISENIQDSLGHISCTPNQWLATSSYSLATAAHQSITHTIYANTSFKRFLNLESAFGATSFADDVHRFIDTLTSLLVATPIPQMEVSPMVITIYSKVIPKCYQVDIGTKLWQGCHSLGRGCETAGQTRREKGRNLLLSLLPALL